MWKRIKYVALNMLFLDGSRIETFNRLECSRKWRHISLWIIKLLGWLWITRVWSEVFYGNSISWRGFMTFLVRPQSHVSCREDIVVEEIKNKFETLLVVTHGFGLCKRRLHEPIASPFDIISAEESSNWSSLMYCSVVWHDCRIGAIVKTTRLGSTNSMGLSGMDWVSRVGS
jgi:hypothetical protein